MKLGFTGTRHGMTELQKTVFEGLLQPVVEFHHGSCKGADVEAARIVFHTFKIPPIIVGHPGPDGDPCQESSGVDSYLRLGKSHFARNRDIVNETDELIATPADMTEQERGGTWYTIMYAQKVKKPVTIIWPNGAIEAR